MREYQPRSKNLNIQEWIHKPITPNKINKISTFFENAIPSFHKNFVSNKGLITDLNHNSNIDNVMSSDIQNLLFKTFKLIKENAEITNLIKNSFAKELIGLSDCIKSLQDMDFFNIANQYQKDTIKLSRMVKKYKKILK